MFCASDFPDDHVTFDSFGDLGHVGVPTNFGSSASAVPKTKRFDDAKSVGKLTESINQTSTDNL